MSYTLRWHAHTGLSYTYTKADDRAGCRDEAAAMIRQARRKGYHVTILETGFEWEVEEPDDSVIIGDDYGILRIIRYTFDCRECGSEYDDPDSAAVCCTLDFDDPDTAALCCFDDDPDLNALVEEV